MEQAAAPTNKAKIEAMCRAAGLMPEDRRTVGDYDLFLADGFSLPPHRAFSRFGIEPADFPHGAYVTFWWLMKGEDRLFVAGPVIFDAFHDPEWDATTKKRARLNKAHQDAAKLVDRLNVHKRMNLNG